MNATRKNTRLLAALADIRILKSQVEEAGAERVEAQKQLKLAMNEENRKLAEYHKSLEALRALLVEDSEGAQP